MAMFGVALEGDMVESFIGEVGNMVAGNAVSALSDTGLVLIVLRDRTVWGRYVRWIPMVINIQNEISHC